MKCMKSLKAGTYQVKLFTMEKAVSKKGTSGLKLLLLVADPDHGGVERAKEMMAFGYKVDELINSVCDQFNLEDEYEFAKHCKDHTVTGVLSTPMPGYENGP